MRMLGVDLDKSFSTLSRGHLLSMLDALKLTAAGVLLVFVVIAAISRLGLEPMMMSMMLWPLAFFGYVLLSQRYVGRNLHWLLGLPLRKLTLAWFNFCLNLSLLVVVNIGCGAVVLATYVLLGDEATRKGARELSQIARDVGYANLLSFLHRRPLAVMTFLTTLVLFMCWSVTRWPDAQDMVRARQTMGKRLLIVVALIFFSEMLFIGSLHRPNAVSPLLIFAAVASLVCLSVPYGAAKALGTSIRQRRAWMLVGGALAAFEILAIAGLAALDLDSSEPQARVEAAKLLGSLGGARAARELEAAPDHGCQHDTLPERQMRK
jgi:hypothetical protein